MTKADFIDAVASRSGLSKKDAGAALDAVLESVKDALKSGDEVTFTGFGKFSVQARKARTGVNPRNPTEKVTIPGQQGAEVLGREPAEGCRQAVELLQAAPEFPSPPAARSPPGGRRRVGVDSPPPPPRQRQ